MLVTFALLAALLPALTAPQGGAIAVTAAARSIQPGEIVVLTIAGPDPGTPVTVRAFDRDWPTFADGRRRRVLIGIDLAVTPGRYPVAITAGVVQVSEVEQRPALTVCLSEIAVDLERFAEHRLGSIQIASTSLQVAEVHQRPRNPFPVVETPVDAQALLERRRNLGAVVALDLSHAPLQVERPGARGIGELGLQLERVFQPRLPLLQRPRAEP